MSVLSVYLELTYYFFIESMLKYICTLKFFEKVRKMEKKWGCKKLYIKTKSWKLKAEADAKRALNHLVAQLF